MSNLVGAPQLKARLKAVQLVPKPIGREWAVETVRLAKTAVPVRTGNLRRSIHVGTTTERKATVVAHYSAIFVDRGTKAHDVTPRGGGVLKWESKQHDTVFAKKAHIPRKAARPFRARVAKEALRRKAPGPKVIKAWNDAA